MKTLVIGGGMSGLVYGIIACKNGVEVTIAERNARVGKKIAMTGNGKCNIGNVYIEPSHYNDSAIVKRVLDSVSVSDYLRFLNSCGIFTYADREGRMYPLSDSAANVVDCLRHQFCKYGGKLLTNTAVSSVRKVKNVFEAEVNGEKIFFDKVVLACGGCSQAQPVDLRSFITASDVTPVFPSLVPVKVRETDGTLNGLRVRANVTLFDGSVLLGRESGEVLFRDYGLSGICILNLSAIIARRLVQGRDGNYTFVLDVVPHLEQDALKEIINHRVEIGDGDKLFYGILHNKLAEHVVRRASKDADASRLATIAKNLSFHFDRLLDWSMSQVTAGGIEGSIDLDTLQLPNGLIALGEALNVDGLCGGYNLFFAAASAIHVFSEEQRDKAFRLS